MFSKPYATSPPRSNHSPDHNSVQFLLWETNKINLSLKMGILDSPLQCVLEKRGLIKLSLSPPPLQSLPGLAFVFLILSGLKYWYLTPLPGLGNAGGPAISLCYLLTVLNYPTTNSQHPFCGWHLNLYSCTDYHSSTISYWLLPSGPVMWLKVSWIHTLST